MAQQAEAEQAIAMSRLEFLWEGGHVYSEIDPALSRSLLYVISASAFLLSQTPACLAVTYAFSILASFTVMHLF